MQTEIKILLIVLMLVSSPWVNGEIYKWVDENGRTHYGEKPHDENATRLEISNTPSTVENSVEERLENREKLLEIYEEERNLKKEQKLREEQEQKQRNKRCNDLADRIKRMERGGVYYQLGEDGKKEYVSEETVSEAKKELEEVYKNECK